LLGELYLAERSYIDVMFKFGFVENLLYAEAGLL